MLEIFVFIIGTLLILLLLYIIGLGLKAKKCLYELVIVPTALYGAEAWGNGSAKRRKVEMKCLKKFGWSVANG